MNNLITLSKHDSDAVIRKIAEILVERHQIDVEELIVIPTAAVAQYTGLSLKSVQRKLPITELSKQKQGGPKLSSEFFHSTLSPYGRVVCFEPLPPDRV